MSSMAMYLTQTMNWTWRPSTYYLCGLTIKLLMVSIFSLSINLHVIQTHNSLLTIISLLAMAGCSYWIHFLWLPLIHTVSVMNLEEMDSYLPRDCDCDGPHDQVQTLQVTVQFHISRTTKLNVAQGMIFFGIHQHVSTLYWLIMLII